MSPPCEKVKALTACTCFDATVALFCFIINPHLKTPKNPWDHSQWCKISPVHCGMAVLGNTHSDVISAPSRPGRLYLMCLSRVHWKYRPAHGAC